MPNRQWRCIAVLAGAWTILLAGAMGRGLAASSTYDCSTIEGWIVLDRNLQPATAPQLTAAEGRVVFEYSRDTLKLLAHFDVNLRDFVKLAVRLRSKEEMMLGAALRDRDQAQFYAMRNVAASEWVTVEFTPIDFELTNDSPVEKALLDPRLATDAYVLLDIGTYAGFASGHNTLEIDWVEITRKDAQAED